MGFRSTFVTESFLIDWPDWFKEKYDATINFPGKNHEDTGCIDGVGCLSSKLECKLYFTWETLIEDIRKAIGDDWFQGSSRSGSPAFVIVFLHECGGISRCQIERDQVIWTEPEEWQQTSEVMHHYCYGCSDPKYAN